MKKRIILCFVLLPLMLFNACKNKAPKTDESQNQNEENFIDSSTSQDIDTLIPSQAYVLNFKSGFEYKQSNLLAAIKEIKSAEDMAKIFAQSKSMQADLNESVNTQFEKEKLLTKDSLQTCFINACDTLGKQIQTLYFTMLAEETTPYFEINNETCLALAKQTKATNDDNFFKLLMGVYGKQGDKHSAFPVWVAQTTDYSGYILLGDKTIYNLLQKIATQKASNNPFNSPLNELYDYIITEIITYKKFAKTKAVVLSELELIAADHTILLDRDRERVLQRIADLKSGIKNEMLEFDCEHGNCHFE